MAVLTDPLHQLPRTRCGAIASWLRLRASNWPSLFCPLGKAHAVTMFYSPVAYAPPFCRRAKAICTFRGYSLCALLPPSQSPGQRTKQTRWSLRRDAQRCANCEPTLTQHHHDSGAKAERQKDSTPKVDTLFAVRLSKHQCPLKT